MTDSEHRPQSVQTTETPHSHTVVTQTPDGSCQATVTVTVQVTTTFGPPNPPAGPQWAPNEEDTNDGGGTKGGLGGTESAGSSVEPANADSAGPRSPNEEDTNDGPGSKGDELSGTE